jgi:CheY-like chemotaxis protein
MARILVVDDVEVVRMLIAKVLVRAGHEVIEADEGAAALKLVDERRPDVVVTDIWMPGVDGLHLIHALHQYHPAIALVAMTAGAPHHCEDETLRSIAAEGVMQVVMKPIDKHELKAAIDLALAQTRGSV